MVVCIVEDRLSEEVAVQFLLLSLTKHCPDLAIALFFPPATAAFKHWCQSFPQIELRTTPVSNQQGWNVKADALLQLLREGHQEVWWIDSDIILSRDFRPRLGVLAENTLVIAEEALYGMYRDQSYRARAWGFEIGQLLPFTLNTGVLRVTPCHLKVLEAWKSALESDRYRRAQTLPCGQKPFHLFGDQDVLTALLASQAFAPIPLKILERGKDIIQYFGPAGYTLKERWHNLIHGLPPFIHCQREKPWHRSATPPPWRRFRSCLDYVRLEVSPYCFLARRYRAAIAPTRTLQWLNYHSLMGKFLAILGCGHPALTGLPISLLYSLSRLYKKVKGIDDQFNPRQAYHQLQLREAIAVVSAERS
ncbi:MAG: hypothetical protein NW220_23810 [Leptolyngbyaceae cyanobacterium bins.349]|nr:hypothetical protein [Leptolyngbyaceae cyanobacterium bins.349]